MIINTKRIIIFILGAGLWLAMSTLSAAPEFTLKLHHFLGPKTPIHTNDAIATKLAICEMFDDYLADESKSVYVRINHVHASQAIHMTDQMVTKPEDLASNKIRIPIRTGAWIIQTLNAKPIGIPVPDKLEPVVYCWIEDVDKKGIDGKALVEKARTAVA